MVKENRRTKVYQKGDERILGDGDFVEEVLRRADEQMERTSRLTAQGVDSDKERNRGRSSYYKFVFAKRQTQGRATLYPRPYA
jgi:hypothetical protein